MNVGSCSAAAAPPSYSESAALQLPTFIDNHDAGRFGLFVRRAHPTATDEEVLQRTRLALAMLLTLRGVPTLYYGDEQGFVGVGDDQAARQDMFASQVVSYNQERLLGSDSTTASSNFNTAHPLYRLIARLALLRQSQPALRHGLQRILAAGRTPGLFAVARVDPSNGREIVVAFNTSRAPLVAQVAISSAARDFTNLYGQCAPRVTAPGSYRVTLAPLDFVICAAAPTP